MTGNEVVVQVQGQRSAGHCCIKSWGKDHKLIDFELIDRFIARTKADDAFDGFELLDLEQMWRVLTELDPDSLMRVQTEGGEMIEWVWHDRNGREVRNRYPFSAEGIMTIMNDELFA
jgi:hypothetical protein